MWKLNKTQPEINIANSMGRQISVNNWHKRHNESLKDIIKSIGDGE